jgi:adenosylcobinamide-phosphate synthase
MWPLPAFGGAALALVIERFTGYPEALYRAIGHPVEWMGRLIAFLDDTLNDPGADEETARLRGVLALGLLLLACLIPAWIAANLLDRLPHGWIIEAVLATTLIAQTSLRQHVAAVASGLNRSPGDGRRAVSLIVGRDPEALDESGVARAALESLAENASDGIVAPALWYALLGLPGLVLYKAINTADSMIGHKSERYLHFGWAPARLDDLVNWPAARLTGLLFAAAAGPRWRAALDAMRRDAGLHRSPNAGWPESALAGAMGLRFGGPRSYDDELVDLAWMGDGREELTRKDIADGLTLHDRAMNILLALTVLCAVVF